MGKDDAGRRPGKPRRRQSDASIALAHRPGRKPFIVNEDTRRTYLESRAAGAPIGMAADRAGVDYRTITRAIARGLEALETEDPDPVEQEYARFALDDKKAKGNFGVYHLANIADPTYKAEWQRSAWLLERTDDSFKRYLDVTHRGTGPNGAILTAGVQLTAQMPIVRDLRNLSDEQVETLNEMMLEARNGHSVDDMLRERR